MVGGEGREQAVEERMNEGGTVEVRLLEPGWEGAYAKSRFYPSTKRYLLSRVTRTRYCTVPCFSSR